MSDEDLEKFSNATESNLCKKPLFDEDKVKNHNHLNRSSMEKHTMVATSATKSHNTFLFTFTIKQETTVTILYRGV